MKNSWQAVQDPRQLAEDEQLRKHLEEISANSLEEYPATEADANSISVKNSDPKRPSRIDVRSTPAPGMPGGRTWSIKQKFGE